MNKATIQWNDYTLIYADTDATFEIKRYEDHRINRLGYILDAIRSRSICHKFFTDIEQSSIMITTLKNPPVARYNINDSWPDTIEIESIVIRMDRLYEILALSIQNYITNNYDTPEIILIGKKLLPAIVSGNLPTTKFEINMQKWYRVIYIPDMQDIIILSNRDIKR